MNRKSTRIMIALLAIAVMLNVLVSTHSHDDRAVHAMSGDYPVYGNLKQIVDRSTVVVRAQAVAAHAPRRVIPAGIDLAALPPHKAAHIGYLVTDIDVAVERVLAGPAELAGKTVTVTHLGGETATDRYVMEGQPLSEPGQVYVFFLRQTEDGRYVMVGGAQGRYVVRGGQLAALSAEAGELPVGKLLTTAGAARVEREFETLVRESPAVGPMTEDEAEGK